METKYIVLVTAGKISTEELNKVVLKKLGIKELPELIHDCIGNRDKNGNLDFSFLEVEDGKGKIIITDSDNIIRQINLSILRGSLDKLGIPIPNDGSCEKVKGIYYEEVMAFFIGLNMKVEKLKVTDTGISVPVFDNWIEEVNNMMENLYYSLPEEIRWKEK